MKHKNIFISDKQIEKTEEYHFNINGYSICISFINNKFENVIYNFGKNTNYTREQWVVLSEIEKLIDSKDESFRTPVTISILNYLQEDFQKDSSNVALKRITSNSLINIINDLKTLVEIKQLSLGHSYE